MAKVPRGWGAKHEVAYGAPPVRVTEDAQASNIDLSALQDFVFKAKTLDDLPVRPRTSVGPVAIIPSWTYPEHDRRTSDDLYFYMHHGPDGVMTFFKFPAPPQNVNVSPPQLQSSTRWPLTPTLATASSAADMADRPLVIGMALGSPTQKPAPRMAEPTIDAPIDAPIVKNPADGTEEIINETVPVKPKHSRWRPLKGLFWHHKKGNAGPQQPSYQLKPESTFVTTIWSGAGNNTEEYTAKDKVHHFRDRGRSFGGRRSERHKIDLKRAATTPVRFSFDKLETERSEVRFREDALEDARPAIDNEDPTALPLKQKSMLLDVNIPSVHMERYSIMFGSVLNKGGANRSSKLLARRQANLEKLNNFNAQFALEKQDFEKKAARPQSRNDNSLLATKIPELSPISNGPKTSRPNVQDVTLRRSNTSPAILSPARQTVSLVQEPEALMPQGFPTTVREAQEQNLLRHGTKRGRREVSLMLRSHPSIPRDPERKKTTSIWAPDQSYLKLEAPDTPTELQEGDIYGTSPVRTKSELREPAWDMLPAQENGTSSNTESSISHSVHSASDSESSISTAPTPPNDSPIEKIVAEDLPPPATAAAHAINMINPPRPSRIPRRDSRAPSLPGYDRPRERGRAPSLPGHDRTRERGRAPSLPGHESGRERGRAPSLPEENRRRQGSTSWRSMAPYQSSIPQLAAQPRLQPNPQLLHPTPMSRPYEKHTPSPLDLSRTTSPLAAVASGESPVIGRLGRAFIEASKAKGRVAEKKRAKGHEKPEIGEMSVERKASEVGEIRVGFTIETAKGKAHRRSELVVLEG